MLDLNVLDFSGSFRFQDIPFLDPDRTLRTPSLPTAESRLLRPNTPSSTYELAGPLPPINMSPTLQMASPATFTPSTDALDRHEYGVSKNRKPASTGGGRAWSDDEVGSCQMIFSFLSFSPLYLTSRLAPFHFTTRRFRNTSVWFCGFLARLAAECPITKPD